MKILAVDTSGSIASIAVVEDENILGIYSINHNKTHSTKLVPMLKTILDELEIDVADIDCFGIAIGPGSYTGLRIGVSAIKVLAQVHNKPVVGISTLKGLASNLYYNGYIVPIIDARNENVFAGIYDNNLAEVLPDTHIGINDLLIKAKQLNSPICFTGEAFVFKENIINILGELASFAPENLTTQNASSIAKLTFDKFLKGETSDYRTLVPNYLRDTSYVKSRGEI